MPGAPPLFDPRFALSRGRFLQNPKGGNSWLIRGVVGEREKERNICRWLVLSFSVRKHLKARTPQQWMYLREPVPSLPFEDIASVFSVINCISGDDFRVDATAATPLVDVIVGRKKFMARSMVLPTL